MIHSLIMLRLKNRNQWREKIQVLPQLFIKSYYTWWFLEPPRSGAYKLNSIAQGKNFI